MSNEKFTDGEWEVREATKSQGVEVVCVKNDKYRRVKRVAFAKGARDMNEANAHLISAAPDMYRALRDVLVEYEMQQDGYYTAHLIQSEVDAIRAALAKADGEKQ